MKTQDRSHEQMKLLLTAGIGGMVLGFGVYGFTHFAPAILLGTIFAVLFTLWVTHEVK